MEVGSNFETMGYSKNSGLLENLNSIVIGGVALVILIVVVIILKVLVLKYPKVKKLLQDLVGFIFSSIH